MFDVQAGATNGSTLFELGGGRATRATGLLAAATGL